MTRHSGKAGCIAHDGAGAALAAFGRADMESNRAAARFYLGSTTSGEAIDKGLRLFLLG